jgi:hypothetical protein
MLTTKKTIFILMTSLLSQVALASSLHVCANGIYYVTPLNSNGTPSGPTVVSGNCSGGDWACVSELMVSPTGGAGTGHQGHGIASDEVIKSMENMNLQTLDVMSLAKEGLIKGNSRQGYNVIGVDKKFIPEKLKLDSKIIPGLAVGFLKGIELVSLKN